MKYTSSKITALAAAACVLLATGRSALAGHPRNWKPGDVTRLLIKATSTDPADQADYQRGLAWIDQWFKVDPADAAQNLRSQWGQMLLANRENDRVAALALTGILAASQDTDLVNALMRLRVMALLAAGHATQASAAAKQYYNVAAPNYTADALTMVADALQQENPNDPTVYERFAREQLAGSHADGGTYASPMLAAIAIDPAPFAAALATAQKKSTDSADYNAYAAYANLLLLSGRCDDAYHVFDDADAISTDDNQSERNLAGAMKAIDGTVGRANHYLLGLGSDQDRAKGDSPQPIAIPWYRDRAHPTPVKLPVAEVPRINSLLHPVPFTAAKDIPLIVVPFGEVGTPGHRTIVNIPPYSGIVAARLRDPDHPAPIDLPLAELAFSDQAAAAKPQPLAPMAIANDQSPSPAPSTQPDQRDTVDDQKFIVSLCRDLSGRVWVGTEDQGVWCYDATQPKAKQWVQYTTQNGLGDDDAYALACDKLGRIWVGHLNHGVSVFNGDHFKNYGVLDGPIGERVFSIAVCPIDGDVWIATSAGLTRYSQKKDDWSYVTRAEGLPSDQASSIAFDNQGNIVVGTQCDGITMADAKDDYKTWRTVHAQQAYQDRPPLVPAGDGLPTDLINQVLVAHDGTIYAATTTGMAWSSDKGKTWQFSRGADWADKVRGLYGGPPKGWDEKDQIAKCGEPEWQEDYLTCLAEDANGLIWVGTRSKGYDVLEPKSRLHQLGTTGDAGRGQSYISAILPTNTGPAFIGQYEGGLVQSKTFFHRFTRSQDIAVAPAGAGTIQFPSVAKPPTVAQLQALERTVEKRSAESVKVPVAFEGEDWSTEGDWVGHLGNERVVLAAMSGAWDLIYGSAENSIKVHTGLENTPLGDGLRRWIHTLRTTNLRSLYNPMIGTRRQSEWDDHGEAYPMTTEGPGIVLDFDLPPGPHLISLYFVNKDGHYGSNRSRDYVCQLGKMPKSPSRFVALAQTRVRDFWNGVYEQFAAVGPAHYEVRIHKNFSFNTICSGIFCDSLSLPPGHDDQFNMGRDEPYLPCGKDEELAGVALSDPTPLGMLAYSSWQKLRSTDSFSRAAGILFFRAAIAGGVPAARISIMKWDLGIWDDQEREKFESFVDMVYAEFYRNNPQLKHVKL